MMMSTPPPRLLSRPSTRRPDGFTLVELLVVIGIVVLLVAIVLPTIGKARIVAQAAKSQADMVSIAGAIERYYNDHRAYPGVVRNADITVGTNAGYQPTGQNTDNIGAPLTMTENLVLTLCGGFMYRESSPGVPTAPGIIFEDIGKGPLNMSPLPAKRVRSAPYIDASPGTLFPRTWDPKGPIFGMVNSVDQNPLEMPGIPRTGPGKTDSYVPEFVDAYSDARPILYMRATVGGAVVKDPPSGGSVPADAYLTDLQQYNAVHLQPYRRDKDGEFLGDFTNDLNDPTDYENYYHFLRHPTIANSPRGKDKYLLIGAGRDRRYGTIDDVLVGG